MRVAVAGATGQVGSRLTEELLNRGHELVAISRTPQGVNERHAGVTYHALDISQPSGLEQAFAGCDAIIDVSDGKSRKASKSTLVKGSENLAAAAQRAGVQSVVLLSIVGIEKSDWYYYQAKLSQERTYQNAGLPHVTVQRTTQFHSFLDYVHSMMAGIGIIGYMKSAEFQTVDITPVVQRLADLAEQKSATPPTDLAGPSLSPARDLARAYKEATGRRGILMGMSLPGAAGKVFKSGYNVPMEPEITGVSYTDYLKGRQ